MKGVKSYNNNNNNNLFLREFNLQSREGGDGKGEERARRGPGSLVPGSPWR